jgi:N-acetylglutamate synthase-like GNAT family acetyltransferase
MQVRSARAADLKAASAVILAAKAHWGYSAAQIEQWRESLLPSEQSLESWPTFVAEIEGQVVGFAQADPTVEPWELVSCWVQPGCMSRGIGSALLKEILAAAAVSGQEKLSIDSDPNAERFYLSRGASRVGQIAAPIYGEPARVRPQLHLPTRRGLTPRSS